MTPAAPGSLLGIPIDAHLVALLALPGMGPARLQCLLKVEPNPAQLWHRLGRGWPGSRPPIPDVVVKADQIWTRWVEGARELDLDEVWGRLERHAIGATILGGAAYPHRLAADLDPPVVLFFQGRLDLIASPLVAIVGTRRCSRYGHDVARRMGHDLAAAGVTVVSGLAAGIDGAAHHGCLEAGGVPVGVVAAGLDIAYPRRHAQLHRDVARQGVLLGEVPPGVAPDRWRFPARNRIIAALADAVVVVESGLTGGSLHTVAEALRRDLPVLAVPGPVGAPSSAGTNRLLAEGAGLVTNADDVLLVIGRTPADLSGRAAAVPVPEGVEGRVLELVPWRAVSIDDVCARSGLPVREALDVIDRLIMAGHLARTGGFLERALAPTESSEQSEPTGPQ
ncbi:MAG: DNA-protecting protein DprA [Actinomycetia bacterium]|nr:DNA-protecting protein DprA [Actinomycetes bacterium]